MSENLSSNHAVYVGSLIPRVLTLGHVDIIRRAAAIFDRLTVGIGINPDKRPLFSPEERLLLTCQILKPFANVDVLCFQGRRSTSLVSEAPRILADAACGRYPISKPSSQ